MLMLSPKGLSMTYCKNHSGVPDVHDGLCQPCLDARKQAARANAGAQAQPTPTPMTPEAILGRYGAIPKQKDTSKGYYLVNGEIGMHVHVYGSDAGMHVKVGKAKYKFFDIKGNFVPDEWAGGAAAVHARATQPDHNLLLAAMGKMLLERGAKLPRAEIQRLIAALPFI
ncbi:MAG: hypothetical protein Q8K20_04545 [Gemmobacter sp.]|nr:hypothetical protein [Gemmobacter sp.]